MTPLVLSGRFILISLLAVACDASRPNGDAGAPAPPVADPRESTLQPDSASSDPDSAALAEFIAAYPDLTRVGEGFGVLLFPSTQADIVDSLRSALPPGHPLHEISESGLDDRVLIRWRTPAGTYYVVHTEGPSGDPGFYLVDPSTGHEGDAVWGEVLALPESGEFSMFQRTNTFFAKRKRVRVEDGRLLEVPAARYFVGLRTIALDSLLVFTSEEDSTIVVRLGRGDSLEVREASDSARAGGRYPLWIRTAAGLNGWLALEMPQCPAALLRGLCFLGD